MTLHSEMVRKTLSKEVGKIEIGVGNAKMKFCITRKRSGSILRTEWVSGNL